MAELNKLFISKLSNIYIVCSAESGNAFHTEGLMGKTGSST